MTAPAPGRYCLAVCYCGACDHYKPMKRHDEEMALPVSPKRTSTAWDEREKGSSWIDKL